MSSNHELRANADDNVEDVVEGSFSFFNNNMIGGVRVRASRNARDDKVDDTKR